jgi:hypothetical protein
MTPQVERKEWLVATTDSGMVVIRLSSSTVSWVPRDVVNHAYNVAGTVPVGTFDSVEQAKALVEERYSISPADWNLVQEMPFDTGADSPAESHTPEIDGHHIVRHGIHWK